MEPSNVRNKIKEPPNVTKVQSHVMLILANVTIELSNVRKIKVPSNVRKVRSNVILVLPNVTVEPSNVRKNKETIECDKSIVTCNVSTT